MAKAPENLSDVKRVVYEQIALVAETNKRSFETPGGRADINGLALLIRVVEDLERAGH